MTHEVTLAYLGWNMITEPDDYHARVLVSHLGAVDSWQWLKSQVNSGRSAEQLFTQLQHDYQVKDPQFLQALRRWMVRLEQVNPQRLYQQAQILRVHVITPQHALWPEKLNNPLLMAPFALWARGEVELLSQGQIALVGARAATGYGQGVTTELAYGLGQLGWVITSGGAYGIDAAAHRAALQGQGKTIAVLAGGVDRFYPVGNSDLLQGILDQGGVVVSEMPLGSAPRRVRFLQRNRLIAALSSATVVVEAAWRSGALSTAHQAHELGIPVGAVPGPVTSVASAGCHRLLREGAASVVCDAGEVHELAGNLQQIPGIQVSSNTKPQGSLEIWDSLDDTAKRVLDAMPMRSPTTVERLSTLCALPVNQVMGALGRLNLLELVSTHGSTWKRASKNTV